MKIKKSKIYKELYLIDNITGLSQKQMNNFLVCGDINWEYYFGKNIDLKNFEKISDIKITEFYTEKDLMKYMSSLEKEKIQDFEISKDFFAILELK